MEASLKDTRTAAARSGVLSGVGRNWALLFLLASILVFSFTGSNFFTSVQFGTMPVLD